MTAERPAKRAPYVAIDGRKVADLRKAKGLTQQSFAERHGFDVNQLKKWESGATQRVYPTTLSLLATSLSVATEDLILTAPPPRMIMGYEALVEANLDIVRSAEVFLHTTGSRSRDETYLRTIEGVLQEKPDLTHCRILYGPPMRPQLTAHLERLLQLRDPLGPYVNGRPSLEIAVSTDTTVYPAEVCLCMNERRALVVLPSALEPGGYDTAVVFEDPTLIRGWRSLVAGLCHTGRRLTCIEDLHALTPGRSDLAHA